METSNKDNFSQLLKAYFDGTITHRERKALFSFFVNNQKIKEWPEELQDKGETKERIYSNIKEAIEKEAVKQESTRSIIEFNFGTILKVAASVVIFLGGVWLYEKTATEEAVVFEKPISTKIEIGKDKAYLTLEDGTILDLEKKAPNNPNVTTTKQKITYHINSAKESAKIAYNYLTIPRGGQYNIELADGTKVWLNSESKLKFPVNFRKSEPRVVELLYGEAYFEVTSSTLFGGSRFYVKNNNQEVEVLGTEFNIKAYLGDDVTYTTLVEGKVKFSSSTNSLYIKPSQQVVFDKKTKETSVYTVDTYSETAWREGMFAFKNKSLKEIMIVLSRWYDVSIVFENKKLETIEFKGVLSKNQKIEDILSLIKNTKFINAYDINDRKITIK